METEFIAIRIMIYLLDDTTNGAYLRKVGDHGNIYWQQRQRLYLVEHTARTTLGKF